MGNHWASNHTNGDDTVDGAQMMLLKVGRLLLIES